MASSFMSGFGDAFVSAYSSQIARSEATKQDNFQKAYDRFLSQEQERKKNKDRDSALVKQAKTIAEIHGAPKQAWPTIRNWLDSGLSPEEISKQLKAGAKFTVNDNKDRQTEQAFAGGASQDNAPTEDNTAPVGDEFANPDEKIPVDQATPEAAFPPDPAPQPFAAQEENRDFQDDPQGAMTQSISEKSGGTIDPQGNPVQPQPQAQPQQEQAPQPAGPTMKANPKFRTGLLSQLSGKFGADGKAPPQAQPKPQPQPQAMQQPQQEVPPQGVPMEPAQRFTGPSPMPAQTERMQGRIGSIVGMSQPQVEEVISEEYVPQTFPEGDVSFTPAPVTTSGEFDVNDYSSLEKSAIQLAQATRTGDPRLIKQAQDFYNAQKEVLDFKSQAKARAEAEAAQMGAGVQGGMIIDPMTGQYMSSTAVMRTQSGELMDMNTKAPVQGQFIPWNEDQQKVLKDVDDFQKNPEVVKYRDAVSAVPGVFRSVGVMTDIAEKNPLVLRPYVAGAARVGVGLTSELDGALQLMQKSDPNSIVDPTLIDKVRQTEATLSQQYLGGQITNLAEQSALFEAQRTLAAYDLARANGQTGQSLSNKDLESFKEAFTSTSGSVNGFKQKVGNVLQGTVSSMRSKRTQIQGVQNQIAGAIQGRGIPREMIDIAGEDPEIFVSSSSDPFVQKGMQVYGIGGSPKSGQQMMDNAASNQGAAPSAPAAGDVPSPQSQEEYDALPAGTIYKYPDGSLKRKKGD